MKQIDAIFIPDKTAFSLNCRSACKNEQLKRINMYKYNPLIHDFFKANNIAVNGGIADSLKHFVYDQNPFNCKKVMEYNDWLKWYGHQHIFLFKIKRECKKYLFHLADKKEFIGDNPALNSAFNDADNCFCGSDEPLLLKAEYLKNEEGTITWLRLCWVENRYTPIDGNPDNLEKERSTNFFIVNLESGEARLQLQVLKSSSVVLLKKAFFRNQMLVRKFIELDNFDEIRLQPLMKHFFKHKLMQFSFVKLKIERDRKVETLVFSAKNMDAAWLKYLPIDKCSFEELHGYTTLVQKTNGNRRIMFTLDGITNSITFNSIVDKSNIDLIVDIILDQHPETTIDKLIENKYLKQYAKLNIQHLPIVIEIDRELKQSVTNEVDSVAIEVKTYFQLKTINEIVKNIVRDYPSWFTCTLTMNSANNKENYRLLYLSDNAFGYAGIHGKVVNKSKGYSRNIQIAVKSMSHVVATGIFAGGILLINYVVGMFADMVTPEVLTYTSAVAKVLFAILEFLLYYGPKSLQKILIKMGFYTVVKVLQSFKTMLSGWWNMIRDIRSFKEARTKFMEIYKSTSLLRTLKQIKAILYTPDSTRNNDDEILAILKNRQKIESHYICVSESWNLY